MFGAAKQMLKAVVADHVTFCYLVGTYRHFGGTYLPNCMASHSICIVLIIYIIFYIIIIIIILYL